MVRVRMVYACRAGYYAAGAVPTPAIGLGPVRPLRARVERRTRTATTITAPMTHAAGFIAAPMFRNFRNSRWSSGGAVRGMSESAGPAVGAPPTVGLGLPLVAAVAAGQDGADIGAGHPTGERAGAASV